jgi:hypothetical protein
MLSQMSGERQDLLGGAEQIDEVAQRDRNSLAASWNIQSREDLLGTIQKLLEADGDRTAIGWNYPRAVNLARWGYAAGYLQEQEAWNFIMPLAERLQQTFSSWQEFGQCYMHARADRFDNSLDARRDIEYAYRELLTDHHSPWRKYAWSLDLGNGHPVPASTEKTAWLTLAAHPAGLICVRLGVPNHRANGSYLSAIAEAVGCSPRVTGDRRNGPDWILETECYQPDTLHGAQIIVRFRTEALAEQLRREGVTELFTYVQHIPNGSLSALAPPMQDGWLQDGWHWYVDMRSLKQPLPASTLRYGVPPAAVRRFIDASVLFIALSLGSALAIRRTPLASQFRLFYWGMWLVLAVSFQGLAIAGFWSGGEGTGADIRALIWFGTLALLLRFVAELLLASAEPQSAATGARLQTLRVAFWRVTVEAPFALVLVLLCDPQRPLDLGSVIALLALGTVLACAAGQTLLLAEGLKGGVASAGEFPQAIQALAGRMRVPLRKLYILPAEASSRIVPKVGLHGDLLVPERLLGALSRREVAGIVSYDMMLIKNKHLNSLWLSVLPMLIVLVWRAYAYQNSPSANLTLLREAGIAVSAFAAFRRSLRSVHSHAEQAFRTAGGDAQGWIAGLAHIGRLSGLSGAERKRIESLASRSGISPEEFPDLLEKGFPETGSYPVPDYDRNRLRVIERPF